jgi:hypothetical protein
MRADARVASLQHIIAVSGGVKIKNRNPRFEDFMPQAKKEKVSPEVAEARLRTTLEAWAKKNK